MPFVRKHLTIFILFIIPLGTIFIWYTVFSENQNSILTVAFLDVGQGDSIYIQSPAGAEIIIDAGPDSSVLRELGSIMPFYDRTIDAILTTHPDKDHVAGFPEILRRYKVGAVLEPEVITDSPYYASIISIAKTQGAIVYKARDSGVVDLGGGAYLDIIFPDRDVYDFDPNTASVITRLTYKDVSFVFTGDSPKAIEEYVVSRLGNKIRADVLKLGHHGSRTSTSEKFLDAVSPNYAVVSAGKDNQYGHPHAEVLEAVRNRNIEILSTAERGTIIFETNGSDLRVVK